MKLLLRATLALILFTATARAVPVTLRVVDAANKPVANASAQIVDYANRPANPRQRSVATESKATPAGTISLDLRGAPRSDRSADLGNFAPAELSLGAARVSAPGFGARNLELAPGDNVITLGAPARLSGVVRDDAGAPIARATVELLGVEPDATPNYRDRSLAPMFDLRSATTRDDGSWELRDLPTGYAYIVAHAPDKAAHYAQLWVAGGDNQAAPLDLAPAGAIIGRIVGGDGQPIAGVSVAMTDYDDPQSDAAGRFRVENVPLGENTLNFAGWSAAWLGVDAEVKATVPAPGAVVDVGDVKMGAGLLISGTIREQGSGAALPNLELRADERSFRTDANGHFEARVAKPFYLLRIVRDYRKIASTPDVSDDATQFDLGEIKVERAFNWPLDLRDEAGHAAPQATLKFTATDRKNTTDSQIFVPLQLYLTTDGEGAFVPSLPASTYQIQGQGLWGVVAPQTVTIALPAPGQRPAPLQIVVRAFAPTRATGRVVDEKGAPIAGTRVQIKSKQGWASVLAFSGADGKWNAQFAEFAGEPAFDKAEFAAYNFVRGGQMAREGESGPWKGADIVMARTDVALTGRVVGAGGLDVAGVRVGWDDNANSFQFVAPDATGQFVIEGLSAVPTTIFAASADGTRFMAATATPGVPVELKLPTAPAPLARAEIETMWGQLDIKYLSDLRNYYAQLDAPRLYEVARRLDAKTDPTQIGDGLSDYVKMRLDRARTPDERAEAAREGIELLRRFDLGTVNNAMGRIAITAARSDDDELRAWAAKWLDAQTPRVKPLDSPGKIEWYDEARSESVMQVSAALGRADAIKYRDIWIKQIDREHNPSIEQFLPEWGEALWRSDPRWFDEIVGTWPAPQQASALVGALKAEANPDKSKALLARLEKTVAGAPAVAAVAGNAMGPLSQADLTLMKGFINFARSIAPLDAPAALDVLEKRRLAIPWSETDEIAAAIARAAIAGGQDDIARRALQLGLLNNGDVATFALIARGFDADLFAQSLEAARKSAMVSYSSVDAPGWRSVSSYALALRDLDAGTGRLLLEDQWAKRQKTPDSDFPDKEYLRRRLVGEQESLAQAMAFYDVARALQWLSEIEDDRDKFQNGLASTRLSIVVTALTQLERESAGAR